MQYDRPITISTGNSRKATFWPTQALLWSEFVEKLRVPARGMESLAEYMRLPKSQQDELKDVGGFVAGTLRHNRRKAGNVEGRDVLTLDLDNVPAGCTDDVLRRLEGLTCGYAVYSTRKHAPAAPRLRVLLPISRTVTADEYEPLARKLAEIIGMPLCDPSTFEASRLMYWPSCSADSQYVFYVADKPFVDADRVLAMYADWRDMTKWPEVPGAPQLPARLAAKQGDPEAKPGVVGAFCRVYDVYRAMDELLPGTYEPTDISGRYTYVAGSTAGGAVIYDDGKFLYSHHATDPCGGKLVNAFDLVRLHLYGDEDDEAKPDTPVNKLPSYTAMSQRAVGDAAVVLELNKGRYDAAMADFAVSPEDQDANWIALLKTNPNNGRPQSTMDNAWIVLEHDPPLKSRVVFDEFSNRFLSLGALPWDDCDRRRDWTDNDDAGLQWYLEKYYGITGKDKIYGACSLVARKYRINDVQDYLKTLAWDGEPRIDALFHDYLGCVDNAYTRQVSRKFLVGAVARAVAPGVKFDYAPILVGPQGIGKSTLLRLLGVRWYSDSLTSFDGKEASVMLQGVWINEIGELNGMTRSEVNTVKQFLTRTEDVFREPYGRRTGRYPRRCVFCGTTNDTEFLRDRTGSRRFWPIDCCKELPAKSIFNDLAGEVDQIWAEAVAAWRQGERLTLDTVGESFAREAQEGHRVTSGREGIILDFLGKPVPADWDKWSLDRRRAYWSGGVMGEVETEPRRKICAAEVWCELYGSPIERMRRQEVEEINGILARAEDWDHHSASVRCGPYGVVKGFKKMV